MGEIIEDSMKDFVELGGTSTMALNIGVGQVVNS
jgi:hypothetical protein